MGFTHIKYPLLAVASTRFTLMWNDPNPLCTNNVVTFQYSNCRNVIALVSVKRH